ncbi:13E12 repeat family protein, partial [Mycobacterium asiaticum]|uniref:13E12 repeat family protein n=1 Tax=Mycobacterium asiaticum TaxID=1790 RepID=UPI000AD5735D
MFEMGADRLPIQDPLVFQAWLHDMYAVQRKALRAPTDESTGWIEAIRVGACAENQAAASQLVAIGQLFRHRLAQSGEPEDWAVDTMEAVAAEVAAGLKVSQGRAHSQLQLARALRERLPLTGAVFCAGEMNVTAFATIVFRTDLISDPDVLAVVDERIAANVARWPSLTASRLGKKVDAIVVGVDVDAVRRRKERHTDREVVIGEDHDGVSSIEGRVRTTDAHALDASLSALAATVCPHDPRTREQRRADAVGALAARADRLACLCGRTDCTAGARRPASPVVIHVIAEQAALNGTGTAPAAEIGAEELITADMLAELAQSAKLVPLIHPGYSPAEPQY